LWPRVSGLAFLVHRVDVVASCLLGGASTKNNKKLLPKETLNTF